MIPCVIFEDEHLLVVNKPSGWNTHAPSPHAGEGIYDWLKRREPRWSKLATIHRLDKETSGVMVFSKTALANRSLTEQFARREVRKKYLLLTDGFQGRKEFTVRSTLARAGDRYQSRPPRNASGKPPTPSLSPSDGERVGEGRMRGFSTGNQDAFAETRFRFLNPKPETRNPKLFLWEAEPLTGRTHQIRVHASENGFPILGDTLYGGTGFHRICLHAAELHLRHPAANEPLSFSAPADFDEDTSLALRHAFIEPDLHDAFRLIHGASDGWPGWHVENLGPFLLSQSNGALTSNQKQALDILLKSNASLKGAYHKILSRQIRGASPGEASPQHVLGKPAPEKFLIRENGIQFEMSFSEGYSVGLFLDQRDNRRRFLTNHIAPDFRIPLTPSDGVRVAEGRVRSSDFEILNTFAYTCGFSVCAAKAGARVTSLDLSKKYLDWGRRNFELNGLDPAEHDFIYGDAFDWMQRLAKKNRRFDAIILDPPTFSQSKERGVFRAERNYGDLANGALPLLKADGILFASTNAAEWRPELFLKTISETIRASGRKILQEQFIPQPPDFPITRAEPAYLKTIWLRIR